MSNHHWVQYNFICLIIRYLISKTTSSQICIWHRNALQNSLLSVHSPTIEVFVFVFKSGHHDQITCSLLGGFSIPRTAVTQSLDSGLCSMLYLVNFHVHSSALAPLHYAPLDPLALLSSSCSIRDLPRSEDPLYAV